MGNDETTFTGKRQVITRIPQDEWDVLKRLADENERPVTYYVRLAVRQYVDRRLARRSREEE